jgi:hypothetical protein
MGFKEYALPIIGGAVLLYGIATRPVEQYHPKTLTPTPKDLVTIVEVMVKQGRTGADLFGQYSKGRSWEQFATDMQAYNAGSDAVKVFGSCDVEDPYRPMDHCSIELKDRIRGAYGLDGRDLYEGKENIVKVPALKSR